MRTSFAAKKGSDARTRRRAAGFTLMEALVTIGLTAMMLAVFSSVLMATVYLRRSQNRVQASDYIQEELDTLRSLPYVELVNRTNGNFLGVAATRGPWKVEADATAPSAANVLALRTAQAAIVEETGLAVLPGNYRDNFTFTAKVKALTASPAGWGAGIAFRYRDAENHYRFRFTSGGIALDKVVQGTKTTLWSQSVSFSTNTWYTLEVTATNQSITLKKNGTTLATVTDGTFSTGDLALLALNGALMAADDAAVTDTSTTTWNFDADPLGALPSAWRRMSVFDLPDGAPTLTIANYLGETNMKQATATVTWTDLGMLRSMTGSTVIAK